MFDLRLSYMEGNLDLVSLRYINCKRDMGLFLKIYSLVFDEMMTKFVLNAILHHVGMSWIIISNKEMKYETDKNNHQGWLNKGPWYNTSIHLNLHGSMFEDFMTHARTDRYNLMCHLVAHDKMQPNYEDDESSLGDRSIPKDATTKELTELGATLNYIDVWLKLFLDNYRARCDAYVNAMKEMFKKIPLTMKKELTPKQKVQKLMTDIGGGWYMGKSAKVLPPSRRTKLSKKEQEQQDEIKKSTC